MAVFRFPQNWASLFKLTPEKAVAPLEQRDQLLYRYLDNVAAQIAIASSVPGPVGPPGATGATGSPGTDGTDGSDGAPGAGVPTGGVANDVLLKSSGTDYDDSWSHEIPLATLVQVATSSFLGRRTASTGDVEVLSVSQAKTLLALASTDLSDFTEAVEDVVNLLIQNSSEITWTYVDASNTLSAALVSASVALSKIADMTTNRVLGRVTAGSGVIEQLTPTQVVTMLALVIGTNVQAWDADLDAIAALGVTNDSVIQGKSGAWSKRTIAQLLVDLAAAGTTFQPLDSDLTTIAALTATTDSFLQAKSSAWAARTVAQVKADLGLGTPQTFTVVRRGGGTADTLGSGGTNSGRYVVIDGVCYFSITWVFGTSGAVANGGATTFDAPVAFSAANDSLQHVGSGHGIQAGANFQYQVLRDNANNGFQLYGPSSVTAASPGSVTFSDSWRFSGSYRV